MALLFMDSFDHYSTPSQGSSKYTFFHSNNSIGLSNGRNGTNGLQIPGGVESLYKQFSTNYSMLIVGFAWKTSNALTTRTICAFRDNGTIQIDLRTTGGGLFQITRNGTVLATGSTIILPNVGYHIQFKASIADSGGVYEMKLNAVTEISGTGDTKNTVNAFVNQIFFSGQSQFDDLWVCDNSGSVNNDFLGDVRIVARMPDSAGNYTQWTPSTGSNWQCVDETAPNDDTDYVSSLTAGQKDSYNFAAVGLVGPVKGIQILASIRKDDAGTRFVRRLVRLNGSDFFGGNLSVPDSYSYQILEMFEKNPETLGNWTIAEIDAAQFGLELVS